MNSTFSCVTVFVTINANSSNGPIYIANHIQFTYYVGCVHYCLSFPFRFCVVTLTCSKAPSLNMTQCAKSVRASVISGFSPILSNRKPKIRKFASSLNTCIFCEANGERWSEDFLLKEILLVEEEDDGGVTEPLVVADRIEQLQTLLHSVLKEKCAFLFFPNVFHCPSKAVVSFWDWLKGWIRG